MKCSEIGDLHIKQFDALFDESILDNVVSQMPPAVFKNVKIVFDKIEIQKPSSKTNQREVSPLMPSECRLQNLTYGGKCYLKYNFSIDNEVIFNAFKYAGIFPVMIKSSLCHLTNKTDSELIKYKEDFTDPGGYFIVNGYERILRFHIGLKRNIPFVVYKKAKEVKESDYCSITRSVGQDEIGHQIEIKHYTDESIFIKIFINKKVYLIPVILVLRALKTTTDEEIFNLLEQNPRSAILLSKSEDISTFSAQETLKFLESRLMFVFNKYDQRDASRRFINILYPHLSSNIDKFNYIIYSINKLYHCLDGKIAPDDRDLLDNQELLTETQIFALCLKEKLFEVQKTILSKLMKHSKKNKDKTLQLSENDESSTSATVNSSSAINTADFEAIDNFTKDDIQRISELVTSIDINIQVKYHRLLAVGNITTFSSSDILQKTGFSVFAERTNFWRFASILKSVSRGSFFTDLKVTNVRKLRPEAFGFICPINTPDGIPCGLLNHLTMGCEISYSKNTLDIAHLYELGAIPDIISGLVPIFYNGKIIGSVEEPVLFVESLRKYRIDHDLKIEIVFESSDKSLKTIYIFDDLSRLMRKIFNKEVGREEYIGVKEQLYLDIELDDYLEKDIYYPKKDFLYKEISNTNLFSLIASCISFMDHNPSPRNMYQCQMAKQTMSVYAYNCKYRFDAKTFVVNYLQHFLVHTESYKILEDYPMGINCIVSVLSYTAYDMEDALILNKAAVERGLFGGFVYTSQVIEVSGLAFFIYTVSVGSVIRDGDLICKYESNKTLKSEIYNKPEEAIVDTVIVQHKNGKTCLSIKYRYIRNPVVGDKFCSRHGQKGVCSMIWPEEDMPFTEQGCRPDIIINPHAFPSRMTIGMLLESMCGKVAICKHKSVDATPFELNSYFLNKDDQCSYDTEKLSNSLNIGEELRQAGFNYFGNEPMYSGVYGTEFRSDVFTGFVYYQRLKHMVSDKFQVRTSGQVVSNTRQPVGGRSKKGGIRFGEMERDALLAHGTAALLKDRLMNCSDKTTFLLCKKCKTILFYLGNNECSCGGNNFEFVDMPYVFKYLCSELLSMNIKVELNSN